MLKQTLIKQFIQPNIFLYIMISDLIHMILNLLKVVTESQAHRQSILKTDIPIWIPKKCAQNFHESKRCKLFCLKYFRAFNAFKHLFKRSKSLKIPHRASKTTLAQSRKRKYEIVIATFVLTRYFFTFWLYLNSINYDHKHLQLLFSTKKLVSFLIEQKNNVMNAENIRLLALCTFHYLLAHE